ncbi:MAG: hypothetical protein H6917_02545 [Novosphingobium sp.]|nr:hypothetical protein [Novosphingobium sp.]MCP5401250.1 hypothetical protein [Novosphingobium sp.]
MAFGVLLALLSGLPFLVATHPQLTDYASHLARYHVMLDGGHSAFLSGYYDFEWRWTGNLGADLLMWPLGRLLGVETAGWLIGLLLPPLTGLAVLSVEWVLRRRIGIGSLLAFALIWSPAMGMGFYNFCLSLALALFAFAGWVRLDAWRWRWLLFLPVGLVVWLCHVAGWGVLGVLVFGYEWQRRKRPAAFLAPWPLTLLLVPLLLTGGAKGGLSYGPDLLLYKIGIWLKAMREQSMQLDLLSLGILVGAILAAVFFRRIDGRLGWAALIFAVLTIVVPRHLGGGDFADWRLIAVALMIGCLAIDWPAPRWVLVAASALFIVRLGVTSATWQEQSRELEAALGALDHLPQGARVAGAVVVEASHWGIDPFEHAPSYATVRRDALVNSHFAVPGIHMLRLREPRKDFVDPSQRIYRQPGEPIDLAAFAPARHADYLWYFGEAKPDRMPPGAQVVYRTQGSFLARLAKPQSPR